MKKKRWLVIVLIFAILMMPASNIYAASSKTVNINWANIAAVGNQPKGSDACFCYALAYSRTILDGKVHYWNEYDYNGGGNVYDACGWYGKANYTLAYSYSPLTVFQKAYDSINNGRPFIVWVTGKRTTWHYIAIVGYQNVSSLNSLNASNFLIIDSCQGVSKSSVENMGAVGYSLKSANGSYQYCYTSSGGTNIINPVTTCTVSPTIAKTSMNIGETCIVGGTVSSGGSKISSVTAGVYTNANGTGCVNGIQATRYPNNYYYNLSSIDAAVHFERITSGGTYYFVVKATLANGTSKTASKQFTVRGAQCGQPAINTANIDGGKQLAITGGASDTVNYTVKRNGTVVDSGTSAREFKKNYTVAGKYSVTAYATRSGYTKSNSKTIDFNIEQVALPKINQSAFGDHMAVNIVSDTAGVIIYYTTSGNTPSISSTRYNGTITLNEQKTIKAIAVKSGMANSAIAESTIKIEEPEAPSGLTLTGANIIPMGEAVSVKWNAVQLASGYMATLYQNGKKVKDVTTSGTTASFLLLNAGEYTINVYATNFVGNSTEATQAVTVKAMAPSTVNFKDWDGSIIKSQEVPYGYDAVIPADPERKGYTFLYWKNADKVTSVKEDLDVTAVYKINTYTVRFYNKTGNQVGPAQKVNYLESATSPEDDLNDIPTGYVFAGWKVIQASDDSAGDYKAVDSDMKLQAVYYWHNNELPVVTEIVSARQNVKTGNYNVTVKLTNYPEDTTTAILRVSLLTKDRKMVKTTKSEVEVDEDGTTTKTVTLKYSGIATKASAVVLGMSGDDQTSSAYSKEVVADVTVQSNEVWSDWSEWSTTKPEGVSGDALETMTQYRYSDKITTTSASSSMSGWTQYDKKTSWNNWGNWSGWSETRQTASDSKQVESRTEYRYYAFVCPVCGGREPFTGMSDCKKYSLSSSNFQMIWSPVAYKNCNPSGYSYTTAKLHTTSLGDGKNWNFSAGNRYQTAPGTKDAAGPDAVVIRTAYRYRTRSQNTTYYYYKWNDWSEWGETVYSENDTRKVESRTLYRTREKVPVYSPLAGTEEQVGNVYHIKGKLSSIETDLKGKLATVMVYKGMNTDPNEDQIQFVGQTTIGENNAYEFDVIPKADPTPVTGDFTVALGIQGSTGLMNVDTIRYERPVYTIEYLNDDGSVISTQKIEEGSNAKVPASPKKAGSYFIGWSENAINVQSNMSITAMYTPADYVVTYVDSVNNMISYDTHHYGDKLTPPEDPTAEGRQFVGWDSILDGKDTVTGNMVVNAIYKADTYTVEFVDGKGTVVNSQKVEYGKSATLPPALDVSGMEFLGWSTEKEWWHVTEDMTVKPILAFQKSVDAPSYYTIQNDDYVALYFETTTEDASIYYTLDESKPDSNSQLYDGNAVILNDFEIKEEIDEENNILTLHRTAHVNAIAIKEEMNDSEVQEIVYKDTVSIAMDVTEATVTFEVNGGTALEESTKTIEIGEAYGELPVPVYKGYDFEGWYTGAEDGTMVDAEDICCKDITLYAHWQKNDDVHEHTIVVDPEVEATCQQEGKTEGRHCSECNEVLVEQKTISKTDHKWNEGEVVKEATCTEAGKIIYTCEYCKATKEETIEKTEHKAENIEGIPAVDPTCTEPGKTAGSYCIACGEIIKEQEKISALGHSFGEWKEVKKATCKETGMEERICETCGTKETHTIEKIDHVSETRNATEATCTMDGYTGDVCCKVCGELLKTGEAITKTNHDWNDGKVLTKSTCNKAGSICYTCKNCGEKKYEDLPLGDHSGGKATCMKKAICSSCGQEYGELNPDYHAGQTEIRNQKDATSTETGYTGDTYCLDCGEKIKSGKTIPVLPAENETIIRIQDKSAAPGDEVTIPVSIEKNAGIAGFSFDVSYDNTILTLKSVTGGNVLSTGQVSTNGDVINWYTSDNVTGNGEILNLVFTVADTAKTGETEIAISPHDGKKNLVDEAGNYVDANYQPGTLEIKKGIIGDINEDTDITIADIVILNRCVLGKHVLSDSVFALADINDDGDITIGDVVILNRHVLGKENILEAREYLIALGDYLGAGGSATISVDDATINPGDTFELPVWIEENTGLAGIALKFEVPEGFTLNSITQSNLLSKGSFSTDKNTCTWYAPTNMKSDGELMVLNLTAGENAKSGKVKVGVKDSDGNNFTDEHGASMLVEFAAGAVKVRSACEVNGHTAGKPVQENKKAATCKKDGSYEEVVYCTVCQEEMSRETKTIPAGHQWNTEYKVDKAATCTEEGSESIHCKVCNAVKEGSSKVIPKISHKYSDWKIVKEATTDSAGSKERVCSGCGNKETAEIPKIAMKPTENPTPAQQKPSINIKVSKTTFTYNGKVQKPKVVVKVGNKTISSASYTITWSKGCKNVGTYKITVKLKGNYSGSKTVSYKIVPKGTSLVQAVSGKAKQNLIKVTWKKQRVQTSGYQIQYGLLSNFKGAKTLTVKGTTKTGVTIKKLKRGKTYYLRIRTFRKIGNQTYISGWSKAKKVKVK